MTSNISLDNITGIYLGDRGLNFKRLIESLLKKGNLKKKYIDLLTTEESMKIYGDAFTSEQIDEKNNYQVYEQLGDLTGNKFIVCYIYQRFPQLRCCEGVKVVARLRINLGSKNSFYPIAEKYGFWEFISATNNLRMRKKKSLLEDVFEAFLGVTETIIDSYCEIGKGYSCVYQILKNIFDDIPISLKYEDLYDSKTRLKELFDIFVDKLGPIKYEEKREELISHTFIYRLDGAKYETKPDGTITPNIVGNYKKILIGKGSAALKADSEQLAATEALKNLSIQGFVKHTPSVYQKFSGEKQKKIKTTEKDILKIIQSEDKINTLFPTKGKNRNQNNYMSTVLIHYCRKRDFGGIKRSLKMGADPNIKDTDGLSSLDVLLIGSFKEKLVYQSICRMIKKEKLDINKSVLDNYYSMYENSKEYSKFFLDCKKKFNILNQ